MRLIKFEALDWCQPCIAYAPIFKEVTDEVDIETETIDIDKDVDQTQKYNIKSVPTTLALDDNGEELGRISGMVQYKRLKKFIQDVNAI